MSKESANSALPEFRISLKGKTTSGKNEATVQAWLDQFYYRMTDAQREFYPTSTSLMATNRIYSLNAGDYHGLVARTEGPPGEPLRGYGSGISGADYGNKWITGDYDLFQILVSGEPCKEVNQKSTRFTQIQTEINKRLGWDAIQHGPQAQWEPDRHEIPDERVPLFKMGDILKGALRGDKSKLKVPITGGDKDGKGARSLNTLMDESDDSVTAVAGNGVVTLESPDELATALICKECEK